MKFYVKDFFSKCDQIRSFLGIWSHLLKKSLMDNFIFCAVKSLKSVRSSEDYAAQKMKFLIKDFSSKCDQIRRKLRIWSHLLEKSLMENFFFCAVLLTHPIYATGVSL